MANEEDFFNVGKQVFRALRRERSAMNAYIRDTRLLFLSFLKRPDEKQIRVTDFQKMFNGFDMDMRFEEETKGELHLRAEELRDVLWKTAETRRMEAKVLLHGTKTNGWLPLRVSALQMNLMALIQLESDRFQTALHALNDYVDATLATPSNGEGVLTDLDGKPEEGKKGAPKKSAKEAKAEAEALGPPRTVHAPNLLVEGNKAIVKAAMEASGPLVAETRSVKEPPKPKGKKDAGVSVANDSASPDLEAGLPVKLPTVLQATAQAALALADKYSPASYRVPPTTLSCFAGRTEAQWKIVEAKHAAIWHEAALLRQRIERISETGSRMQSSLTHVCDEMYAEIDGWIEHQTKLEEASIEEVVRIITEAIEAELPLQYDLRFLCEVLEHDYTRRHVPEPAPLPVPRVLPLSCDTFNDDQCEAINKALQGVSDAEVPTIHDTPLAEAEGSAAVADQLPPRPINDVSTSGFVEALSRLAVEDTDLPPSWGQLSEMQLRAKAKDLGNTDTVDVTKFQQALPRAA